MKPEEINRAVAQCMGLLKRKAGEIVEYERCDGRDYVFQRVKFPDGSVRPCHIGPLPNFFADLNACGEMIAGLPPDRTMSSNPGDYPSWTFLYHLGEEVGARLMDNGKWVGGLDCVMKLMKADAPQLCRAYLKTVNKWTP